MTLCMINLIVLQRLYAYAEILMNSTPLPVVANRMAHSSATHIISKNRRDADPDLENAHLLYEKLVKATLKHRNLSSAVAEANKWGCNGLIFE